MAKKKASQENGGYNPFLKAEHIKTGDMVTLTGWTHERVGEYGPQIMCEVTHNRTGKTYDFAIKVGSPNHRTLFKTMGADPVKWRGQLRLALKAGGRGDYIVIDSTDSDSVPF